MMIQTPSVDIPQADKLSSVRDLIKAVGSGLTSPKDLSENTGLPSRYVAYYLQAGRILGFLSFSSRFQELRVLEPCALLLASDPESEWERGIFKSSILSGTSLLAVAGDFLVDGSTRETLTERLVTGTDLSKETAQRRARTLVSWREYISGEASPRTAKPKKVVLALVQETKYDPDHKAPRSLALVKLWLRSVNIPFREYGPALLVQRVDGNEVFVHVSLNGPLPQNDLRITGGRMTSRNLKDALLAFEELQLGLGYKPKLPVDRGKIPEIKLANGADFDLTAFRHTEFRRVPNPDPKKLKQYEDVVMRTVWKFFRENAIICQDHMLEIGDLKTYAMVWTTTFLGMSEIAPEDDIKNENVRLLYTHLGQRFHDFRVNLIAKARSVLPALDDAHLGQHGRPYEHNNGLSWESQSGVDDDEGFIDRRRREWRRGENFKINLSVDGSGERQDAAKRVLDDLLGSYDHDSMVKLLKEAAENMRSGPDARTEAVKRLRVHSKQCSACIKMHEEISGGDLGGTIEKVLNLV